MLDPDTERAVKALFKLPARATITDVKPVKYMITYVVVEGTITTTKTATMELS